MIMDTYEEVKTTRWSRVLRRLKGYSAVADTTIPEWAMDQILVNVNVKFGWKDRLRILLHGGAHVQVVTAIDRPAMRTETATAASATAK